MKELKKLTQEEVDKIIADHQHWLKKDCVGWQYMCANLSYTNLDHIDISYANLSYANFAKASLAYANLQGANLNYANLYTVNLNYANLKYTRLNYVNFNHADLDYSSLVCTSLCYAQSTNARFCYVNLESAFLGYSDLTYANLRGANLCGTSFEGANLEGAHIEDANLECTNFFHARNIPYIPMTCPEEGSFIAYKICTTRNELDEENPYNYWIAELEIPADARRSSGASSKCRCDKARVLSITSFDGNKSINEAQSTFQPNFTYKVGEMVEEPDFDEDRWRDCSTGIHFFVNRQEAENYLIV